MFDIVKDYNSQIVVIDQIVSAKGSDFYMKLAVDVEVVKNAKDNDFQHYIFNIVNPMIKNYLTNASLDLATKYESANYIMMNAILQFLHNPNFRLDDEDITLISENLNLEDALTNLEKHFVDKYGEESKEHYLNVAKELFPVISYGLSVYSNYRTAKSDIVITNQHMTTFKMIMGKEFMDSAYGKTSESSTSESSSSGLSTKSGCYIATCVYQSYDCPEVWVLRRYRDTYLKKHAYGRLFIKTYYSISPTLVKMFGNTKWFKNTFKTYLDKKVKKLKKEGYSCLPYND